MKISKAIANTLDKIDEEISALNDVRSKKTRELETLKNKISKLLDQKGKIMSSLREQHKGEEK